MRLKRIRTVEDFRLFRKFRWGDLPEFRQFNAFYGWNGTGKTTISDLLAHLAERRDLTDCHVEFEFDGDHVVSGNDISTAGLPEIRVFNRDFVEATVRAFDEELTPIYYFGEESVSLRERLESLREQLAAQQSETARQAAQADADQKLLDAACTNWARGVKQSLGLVPDAGYGTYDKRRFETSVAAMTRDQRDSAILSDERRARLDTDKTAVAKAPVALVQTGFGGVDSFGARLIASLLEMPVSAQIPELAARPNASAWVQDGLEIHRHGSATCLFCGGQLTAERLGELAAHFNDEVQAHQLELDALAAEASSLLSHLESITLPDVARLYDDAAVRYQSCIQDFGDAREAMRKWLGVAVNALSEKRRLPFAPPALPPDPASVSLALAAACAALNEFLSEQNAKTQQLGETRREACQAIELGLVSDAWEEYQQLRNARDGSRSRATKAAEALKQTRSEIENLQATLREHSKPAAELSGDLAAYVGHSDVQLEVVDAGYRVVRGGEPARHLSEGEKTALAFLYFLKSLSDRSFDLKHGIVVIDDPVSSLDETSLFSAFSYLKDRVGDCEQLFVLTHNFSFFRQVKSWYHQMQRQKGGPGTVSFYMTRAIVEGGRRTATITKLDQLLESYESEYHYLFSQVLHNASSAAPSAAPLDVYYGLANVARRLLEAFLSFRRPNLPVQLDKRLDSIPFDTVKKTRILRLLHTYSHARDLIDTEHDLTALAETPTVLQDILELMEAEDPVHFKAMCELCRV